MEKKMPLYAVMLYKRGKNRYNTAVLLSVIIPVYNEVLHIDAILERIKAVDTEKQIIVVDDFSTDGTRDRLRSRKDIILLLHTRNRGKGAAIRTGLEYVKGEIVIIQDADLEYSPEDYKRLLEPIRNKRTRVVYGSRILGRGKFLASSFIANRFLTFLTNILYNTHLTDMETCYKLITSDLFKDLDLISNRFEVEPEITCKILKKRETIVEIPVFYEGRRKGKKIGVRDGIQAIWNIVKWKIRI
jgi:glycosyltransferase involved in cell wall biosynthesis